MRGKKKIENNKKNIYETNMKSKKKIENHKTNMKDKKLLIF